MLVFVSSSLAWAKSDGWLMLEKGRAQVENGRRPSKSLKPVTIAVVGHPGVGRTSLVKRAFRGWGLTSAKLLQVSPKGEQRLYPFD